MKLKRIRSKIMVSIIGITFFTVISIAAVFYREAAQMIEENYRIVLKQRIHLLSETIDEMMQGAFYVGVDASCDNEIEEGISNYLKTKDEKELETIARQLRLYKTRDDVISSIYLLIPKTAQLVTSRDYPVYKSILDSTMTEEYVQSGKDGVEPVILNDIVNDEKKILSFVETVESKNGKVLGYLYTNIEENRIFYDYFDNASDIGLDELILLKKNQVITSKGKFQMGETYESLEEMQSDYSKESIVGVDKKYIYVYYEGKFSGCGLLAKVERRAVIGDMWKMRNRIMEMVILFILLSLVPAAYITQVVSDPLRKLVNTIEKVSKGDIGARAEKVSDDEIGMLSEQFNQMLDQIQKLIQQVIIEEERKKDAELEALQYQITPHFMYNTLSSIKYAALIKGEKEIADVLDNFIEILQTCIRKKGAFLTVAEEIHILEKYICLQEFRSGETISFSYEIQEEAQSCRIPRLILQPLVENALLHGLDIKQKQGRLTIRAWVKEGNLYMEVKDNGSGMTEEQMIDLLTSKGKKTRGLTAVGVSNVRDRIKLYYKEKADLSYKSSDKGTTAMIYLPEIRDGV